MGDIAGDAFDFWGSVGGSDGESGFAHHVVVGDVVADVGHFFGAEARLAEEVAEVVYLHGAPHIDVADTQAFVADAHGVGVSSGDDGNLVAQLDGELHGIAVFDIDGAQRVSVGGEAYHCA